MMKNILHFVVCHNICLLLGSKNCLYTLYTSSVNSFSHSVAKKMFKCFFHDFIYPIFSYEMGFLVFLFFMHLCLGF
jgi:hypothetical protein